MSSVEETVEIAVPVRTAYNQWTQFESFPRFMRSVRKVEQIKPALTSWTIAAGPLHGVFTAEIVEQEPDSHLVWRGLDRRPVHRGEVSFRPTAGGGTRVTVRMDVAARGAAGVLAVVPGLAGRVVRGELGRFKEYIEGLGQETGAWRGAIRGGRPRRAETDRKVSGVPCWPVG
ncbi:SRPBCC family protein [Streptomyces sp. NPDC102395]|uniref:SRPBCC family protein n=1 Tax=Streptomyces sp. NPDC102395 TaxID=3366168 RepID=UPI00381BC137